MQRCALERQRPMCCALLIPGIDASRTRADARMALGGTQRSAVQWRAVPMPGGHRIRGIGERRGCARLLLGLRLVDKVEYVDGVPQPGHDRRRGTDRADGNARPRRQRGLWTAVPREPGSRQFARRFVAYPGSLLLPGSVTPYSCRKSGLRATRSGFGVRSRLRAAG
jgi:hypothetical protein